ncbi:MAG TPA: choice-of-anchor Q domain-containing protein [Thermoleophilaceae bacterium]
MTDDGDGTCDSTCTLRDAVTVADASLDPDITILLPAGTLTLTKSAVASDDNNVTGDVDVTRKVTIRGQGASATTIQQTVAKERVLDALGVDLTLQDLAVTGGQGTDYGGGIRGTGNGQLTLERVAVHDNNVGTDNGKIAHGGGIYKDAGSLLVSDSAIYDNGLNFALYGGGILLETASADIENTTISGNKAENDGGGIHSDTGNAVTLAFDTITGNSAASGAGGGLGDPQHYRIRSSIITGNSGGDCDSAGQDEGGNVGAASCGFNLPSDAIVSDPLLGPLGGTPIPVEEPLPGSPALDRAVGPCPATDARGVTRPQGAGCDSGAAERPVASTSPGAGGGGKAPHLSLASKLSVASNLKTIALKLACPAGAGKCTGSVKLVGTFAAGSAKTKTRKVTIASAHYSLAGGKHKTLKLKVTKAGRKAFRGHRSIKAKLTLSVTDAAGHKGTESRSVKLARAKKKH